ARPSPHPSAPKTGREFFPHLSANAQLRPPDGSPRSSFRMQPAAPIRRSHTPASVAPAHCSKSPPPSPASPPIPRPASLQTSQSPASGSPPQMPAPLHSPVPSAASENPPHLGALTNLHAATPLIPDASADSTADATPPPAPSASSLHNNSPPQVPAENSSPV